jgi:hypothetical protein
MSCSLSQHSTAGKKRAKGKKRVSLAPASPTPTSTPGKTGGNKDKNKRAAPVSAVDRAFKPIKEWYAENTSYRRMGAGMAILYFVMLSAFFYRYEGPTLFVNIDAFVNTARLHTHVPLERSWYDSNQHGWCVRLERSTALLSV